MNRYAITEDGQLIVADHNGNLPPTIKEVRGFAFTTAPEAYDYWYTHTAGGPVIVGDRTWRLVAYTDTSRFRDFQTPRYGSGLYPVFDAAEDEQRQFEQLPTVEQLLGES
jgi:hypothetical protein